MKRILTLMRTLRCPKSGIAIVCATVAAVAVLCSARQASAHDFVVDQSHDAPKCCWAFNAAVLGPAGQEFTPTISTLDVVDLLILPFRFNGEMAVNIRSGSIAGPIVGASSIGTLLPETRDVGGRVMQFDFPAPVPLVPESLYVIEFLPTGTEAAIAGDGGLQFHEDHHYTRGQLIIEGERTGGAIFFRTGSSRIPGFVFHTRFEPLLTSTGAAGPVPSYSTAFPLSGQNGWMSPFGSSAVTISRLQAKTGEQSIRIRGSSLVPVEPGLRGAAVTRNSDLDPIASGNPIVFVQASVRLDGPSTDQGGGSNDDLVSANTKVVDEGGATVAELILSSNGHAYAFANNGANAYNFETPAALGAYHTVGLQLNYLTRTTDYFLDEQYLGTLAFGDNIQSRLFAQPFLELIATDSPALDRGAFTAWYDDFSIKQTPAPEPTSVLLCLLGVAGSMSNLSRRMRRSSTLRAAGIDQSFHRRHAKEEIR